MADEKEAAPSTIDFYTFVVSLASSAFIHLGDTPHPETGQTMPVNLPAAKQWIDLVDMLHGKMKGNLTADEEKFMEDLLMDLQIRYVAKASSKP